LEAQSELRRCRSREPDQAEQRLDAADYGRRFTLGFQFRY
jgi:hypothetical protein